MEVPSGVAYDDESDTLFVGEADGISRFSNVLATLQQGRQPDEHHILSHPIQLINGAKSIRLIKSKTGQKKLVFNRASSCDACEQDLPFSAYWTMNLDGSDAVPIARGIRNSVGAVTHPDRPQELWFSECGRDGLGEQVPCDDLNTIDDVFATIDRTKQQGINTTAHFGYPFCWARPNGQPEMPDPDTNPNGAHIDCQDHARFTPARYCLRPHGVSLGLAFYQSSKLSMFPREFVGSDGNSVLFIAERGSYNLNPPVGFQISLLDTSKPTSAPEHYVPFLSGFSSLPQRGRPNDVLVYPQDGGSLLISDDNNGYVYRVTYDYPQNYLSLEGDSWSLVPYIFGGLVLLLVAGIIGAAVYVLVRRRKQFLSAYDGMKNSAGARGGNAKNEDAFTLVDDDHVAVELEVSPQTPTSPKEDA